MPGGQKGPREHPFSCVSAKSEKFTRKFIFPLFHFSHWIDKHLLFIESLVTISLVRTGFTLPACFIGDEYPLLNGVPYRENFFPGMGQCRWRSSSVILFEFGFLGFDETIQTEEYPVRVFPF